MKNIPEILLRLFLRRYPLPTRISLFSYFGQYAWLKDVLEELRPELFPPPRESLEPVAVESVLPPPDAKILGILERSAIQGRSGHYQAQTYWGPRGNGHLFGAIETTSKRPVVIKEYLLPATQFTKAEAFQRQSSFQRLGGMQLADGRLPEFRVMQPLEAIADTESPELFFLVTGDRDRAPTLRQHLQASGALPRLQVQEVLSQILQSLEFLHQQKFTLPSGAIQNGLIHGNLSLDSVLWDESQSQPFVYLCDLWLWEQWFDATEPLGRSTQVTPDNRQLDLRAVGTIGTALLQGLETEPVEIAPSLRPILEALRAGKYDSASTARRDLLELSARSPAAIDPFDPSAVPAPSASRLLSPLLALSLMGLVVGAFMLWPRLQATESSSAPARPVSTCCLKEVSAIPPGKYRYTAVQGGTWANVLGQGSLLKRNQGLTDALAIAQPKLQLQYVPTTSLDQVLTQVQSGEVDFAILPVVNDLPSDLLAQEIAYDGLATVVSFSYSQRRQGLPRALQGRLSLNQVQQLYQGQINQWDQIAGAAQEVKFGRRYASKNPEAIAIFEQRLLQSRQLGALPDVKVLPFIDLLHQVIRDFEESDIGSVGFLTLSEMWGQCSVYPLALQQAEKTAVQPLVLSNGQDINPETNLCNRKGAYGPESKRFQAGQYPLSYPIMVVYPRDNRRSMIAKKFIELMRTIEGQQLLRAAGLIPVSQGLAQSVQATGEKHKATDAKPQEKR